MTLILITLPKSLTIGKLAFCCLFILAMVYLNFLITMQVTIPSKSLKTDYLIQVDDCYNKDKNIFMLVLVGSHPDHFRIRDVIRQTWGNPRLNDYQFKLVFMFGKVTTTNQQNQLDAEHKKYGDILEGTFVDSYHNVTRRDLMGLRWASQHCQQAKYILRADDDIALDIYKLIAVLEEHYGNVSHLIACFAIIKNATPHRTGRYAISLEDYPFPFYADYCDGWAYVLTPVVAHQLVQMAAQRSPIWINDAYITGTLIEGLTLRHKLLHLRFTYSYNDMISFAENYQTSKEDEVDYELGPIQQNTELLFQIQEIYKRRANRTGYIFENG